MKEYKKLSFLHAREIHGEQNIHIQNFSIGAYDAGFLKAREMALEILKGNVCLNRERDRRNEEGGLPGIFEEIENLGEKEV